MKPSRDDVLKVAGECGFTPDGNTDITVAELERFAAAMYAKGAEDIPSEVKVVNRGDYFAVERIDTGDTVGFTYALRLSSVATGFADGWNAAIHAIRAMPTTTNMAPIDVLMDAVRKDGNSKTNIEILAAIRKGEQP